MLIHELSHFLMAKLLFLRTGKISLFPELHGTSVKLGSVEVERTDFLRSFLVGIAPLFGGIGVLSLLSWYMHQSGVLSFDLQSWQSYLQWLVLGYIAYVVTNTMFSSKKDVESALHLVLIAMVVTVIVLIFFGSDEVTKFFGMIGQMFSVVYVTKSLMNILLIPVFMNGIISILFFILRRRISH